MTRTLPLTLALIVTGCHAPPPEGVYQCRPATAVTDCPTNWFCHAEGHCWSYEETDAGSVDAAMQSDTGADAGPTPDTGPHCGAETCNGTDDDCDGLIDEGVITVGPAVTATTGELAPAALVSAADGFDLIIVDPSGSSLSSWLPIGAAGTPGVRMEFGADVSRDFATDALSDGGTTLVTTVNYDGDSNSLFGFDATGTRTIAATSLPLPGGESPVVARLSQASAARATVYTMHGASAGGGTLRIRRFRVNLAGSAPIVLSGQDIATDGDSAGAFAVLGTASADYVVYTRDDGRIALLAGPADDSTPTFHLVGLIGDGTEPAMQYAALGIGDPTAAVSETNPLAVVWQGRNGGSGPRQTMAFAEVTNTTVLVASAPVTFPDAFGAWGGGFITRTLAVLALGDAPEHWIVVSQDSDSATPTGGLVQVREIVGAGTNVRRVPVHDEVVGPQSQIAVAASGGSVRLVEAGATGGLVTRSIGCE